MKPDMARVNELRKLYGDIEACHICPRMDEEKALRLVKAVNLARDVFIISQSLAANQLRRSGVNFFQANGQLGNTGETLEKFLNQFNRTVYPEQEVKILNGITIPKCRAGYVSVYNTDIAQCYPGKKINSKGDRSPTNDEISNCIAKGFLLREIELIRPKLMLLMGKASRDSFFSHIICTPYSTSLSVYIQNIVRNGAIPQFRIGLVTTHVMPIQHASGANPRFHSMAKDSKLASIIRKVLK
jgi:uracil-DNA glycosylase